MEKRALLAVLLSLIVWVLWVSFFPAPSTLPRAPVSTEPAIQAAPGAISPGSTTTLGPHAIVPVANSTPLPVSVVTSPPIAAATEESEVLSNTVARVVLSNRGASIRSFELVGYRSDAGGPLDLVSPAAGTTAVSPLSLSTAAPEKNLWLTSVLYRMNREADGTVRFEASDGAGLHVVRSFRLLADGSLEFSGELSGGGALQITIGPGARPRSPAEARSRLTGAGSALVRAGGRLDRTDVMKIRSPLEVPPGSEFAALDDAFFVSALTGSPKVSFRFEPVEIAEPSPLPSAGNPPPLPEKRTELRLSMIPGGEAFSGRLVFAPKNLERLKSYGLGLEDSVKFGWGIFGVLARGFLIALRWIHSGVGNWGVSIILLTIVIRSALFGVTFKSALTMKKMQLLAPRMEAIKEKYRKRKGDPESRTKMNQEVMALYQAEGVNPAAGCLPMLLQLPIFIGFYNLLAYAFELRQAPFAFWIHDLSLKDPYYVIPTLMGIAWFAQTILTPATADPLQKKIFLLMPIVFTFMMKDLPAGLTLYWFTSNTFSIFQQYLINRMSPPALVKRAGA